jgi:flagellar biosynthesis/type III secretory pathway M-ring protein FliF/YscJ
MIGENLRTFMSENTFISLVTILFWGGLIVVIVSIIIRPKKRRMVIPEEEPVRADYLKRAAYSVEETVEPVEPVVEQPYVEEEVPQVEEEPLEAEEEEKKEEKMKEEKPGKVGDIVGFCPRCGAPVTEGIRYCRKCGLKLK